MTLTPSHAQIFFVFSPSPALLAMIPHATPVPQLPSLANFTAYSNFVFHKLSLNSNDHDCQNSQWAGWGWTYAKVIRFWGNHHWSPNNIPHLICKTNDNIASSISIKGDPKRFFCRKAAPPWLVDLSAWNLLDHLLQQSHCQDRQPQMFNKNSLFINSNPKIQQLI